MSQNKAANINKISNQNKRKNNSKQTLHRIKIYKYVYLNVFFLKQQRYVTLYSTVKINVQIQVYHLFQKMFP